MHGSLHRHYAAALDDQLVSDLAMAQRAGVRERRATRLRAQRLDERLARGVSPDADSALAARARKLTGRSVRRGLASQLLRVAGDDDLQPLARRLLAPDPVAARGVAMAHLLLTDTHGPLHVKRSAGALRAAVSRTIDALEVRCAV